MTCFIIQSKSNYLFKKYIFLYEKKAYSFVPHYSTESPMIVILCVFEMTFYNYIVSNDSLNTLGSVPTEQWVKQFCFELSGGV